MCCTLTAVECNKIYLDRRRWRDFTDRPFAYLYAVLGTRYKVFYQILVECYERLLMLD